MNIKVLPSALDDLRQGWLFYERQEIGLGDYFQESLFSDIDSLIHYAGIHRLVYDYHRLLSKNFPFAIYYKMAGDVVVVWRILDMREESVGQKLN